MRNREFCRLRESFRFIELLRLRKPYCLPLKVSNHPLERKHFKKIIGLRLFAQQNNHYSTAAAASILQLCCITLTYRALLSRSLCLARALLTIIARSNVTFASQYCTNMYLKKKKMMKNEAAKIIFSAKMLINNTPKAIFISFSFPLHIYYTRRGRSRTHYKICFNHFLNWLLHFHNIL